MFPNTDCLPTELEQQLHSGSVILHTSPFVLRSSISMLSPSSGEQFNRLERILELVTEHERVYREQVCACWLRHPACQSFGPVVAAVLLLWRVVEGCGWSESCPTAKRLYIQHYL